MSSHGTRILMDLRELSLASNGMDSSCEATIYPVLDKPRNSEALGPRGPLLKEICPLVFKIPFTIHLDRR